MTFFNSSRLPSATSTLAPGSSPRFKLPAENREELTDKYFGSRLGEKETNRERAAEEGYNFMQHTAGFLAGTAVNIVDDLWSNRLNPMASERGDDVWHMIESMGESGEAFKNYYENNQGLLDTASGIVGAVGIGYATGGLALPAMTAKLASSTAITGSRLWQAGAKFNAATRAGVMEANLAAAARQGYVKAWQSAPHAKLFAAETGKWAGVAAVEEAAIVAALNGNDLIFDPDDMANNGFWAAVGVGIGGGIGALRARRMLRGFANDPTVISARATAQDAVGITRRSQDAELTPRIIRNGTPAPGASPTRYALEAYQQSPIEGGPLAARVDSAKVGALNALNQDLKKLGFTKEQAAEWSTKHLKNDQLSLHGLTEIRPTGGESWVQYHETQIAQFAKGKTSLDELTKSTEALDSMMVHIDGGWHSRTNSEELQEILKAGPPKAPVAFARNTEIPDELTVQLTGKKSARRVTLSNRRVPAAGRDFSDLSLNQRLQLVEGFKKLGDEIDLVSKPYRIRKPKDSSWMHYDAALHRARVLKKPIEFTQEALEAGIKTEDDLELFSLRLKAKEILENPDALSTSMDFVKWNLPVPTYMERTGSQVGESMRAILKAARDGASLDELRQIRQNLGVIGGYQKADGAVDDLTGTLFNFNRDAKGEWQEPVYATFSRQSQTQQSTVLDAVIDNQVEHRIAKMAVLVSPIGPESGRPVVSEMAKSLLASPHAQPASRVMGLADDQSTGLGGLPSQLAGETRSAEFRHRDNITMQNLIKMSEQKNRLSDAYLTDVVDRHMGGIINDLTGPSSRASRELIHNFHAHSSGWDLLPEPIAFDSGGKTLFKFELAPTQRNAQRLGVTLEGGEESLGFLSNARTGREIVLDGMGLDYQMRFNSLSTELLVNRNRVREAEGLRPISYREWYTPPPPLHDKIVGFVFDANDNIIPNRTVIASTPAEYETLTAALYRDLEREMPGARIRTREDVAAYKDIFDDAAMDWIDPTHIASPVAGQKGGLGTEFVNPNSIQDSMKWVQQQIESLGNAVQRSILDDSIRTARLRHNVEVSAGTATYKGRTIYQEYEAIARGIPLSKLESSISGSVGKTVTDLGNKMLTSVWPNVSGITGRQAARWANDLAQRMDVPESKWRKMSKNLSSYKQLAQDLGDYSPYKNFDDYLTQRVGHTRPPEIKDFTQKFNTVSAALVLRYGEIAHAAMNLAGLMVTMPALVRHGSSHLTRIPVGSTKKTVNMLDTTKILSNAVDDMVRGRSGADWDYMVKNGDASQQVAELNKMFSLLTSQGAFSQVFYGKGTKEGKKGLKGFFNEKGIDGAISVLTDTSENWSRQYAHFVGLRLADMHGVNGLEARHAFARDIANAGIANYSIVNRPELYQSPIGSLFGLFTSWSRAYNQKLFRWLEDGEFTRVAEQYAIQAAMFGARSNVGYNALEWLFEGERDSDGQEVPTITDRIYARLGPVAGMAVANGGIAAVTGVALWTRGDTNIRTPSLNPIENAASLGVLSKIKNIALDTAKYGADVDAVTESIGRNLPNRVLRGAWTELAMGGKEIDSAGRIITESQTMGDSIARFAGVRSTRAQQQAEIYYANSSAMRDDSARMEKLRMKTRAAIRSGKAGQEDILKYFDDYLKSGGNPANFQTWIRSQLRESTSSRDIRQIQGYLNNPNNHLKLWRHDSYLRGFD